MALAIGETFRLENAVFMAVGITILVLAMLGVIFIVTVVRNVRDIRNDINEFSLRGAARRLDAEWEQGVSGESTARRGRDTEPATHSRQARAAQRRTGLTRHHH
jgi:hypothetical protein